MLKWSPMFKWSKVQVILAPYLIPHEYALHHIAPYLSIPYLVIYHHIPYPEDLKSLRPIALWEMSPGTATGCRRWFPSSITACMEYEHVSSSGFRDFQFRNLRTLTIVKIAEAFSCGWIWTCANQRRQHLWCICKSLRGQRMISKSPLLHVFMLLYIPHNPEIQTHGIPKKQDTKPSTAPVGGTMYTPCTTEIQSELSVVTSPRMARRSCSSTRPRSSGFPFEVIRSLVPSLHLVQHRNSEGGPCSDEQGHWTSSVHRFCRTSLIWKVLVSEEKTAKHTRHLLLAARPRASKSSKILFCRSFHVLLSINRRDSIWIVFVWIQKVWIFNESIQLYVKESGSLCRNRSEQNWNKRW